MSFVLIKLTNNKFAKIDKEDEQRVRMHNWFARFDQHTGKFYAWTKINGKYTQLANFIMNHVPNGNKGPFLVDHIYGDPLDNRKEKLRFLTNSQNSINRKKHKNNKTCYIGVYHDKEQYRYMAYWQKDNKQQSKYFKYGKKNKDNNNEKKKAKKLARNYRLEMIRLLPDYVKALNLDKNDNSLVDDSHDDLERVELSNRINIIYRHII